MNHYEFIQREDVKKTYAIIGDLMKLKVYNDSPFIENRSEEKLKRMMDDLLSKVVDKVGRNEE